MKSMNRKMRRARLGATFGVGVMIVASLVQIPSMMQWEEQRTRQNWVALENGGCDVSAPVPPEKPIKPIFAANYPGSGMKMFWNLIEALSGIPTADEHEYNFDDGSAVAVKTHYPHVSGHLPDYADEVPRAIMLLRNPRYTIAALHNFVYEFRNNIPLHTMRAPEDEWIHWRDENFRGSLKQWHDFVIFWMDRYKAEDRLIVPYETLIDPVYGSQIASNVVNFLKRDENIHPIADESVPCVWRSIVKYHEDPRFAQVQAEAKAQAQVAAQNVAEAQPEAQPEDLPEPQPIQPEAQPENPPESQPVQPVVQPEPQPEQPQVRRRLQESPSPPQENNPEQFVGEEVVAEEALSQAQPVAAIPQPEAPPVEQVTGEMPLHDGYSRTFFNTASLRSGPALKPFTAVQIGMMINTMQNLKNRYQDEQAFVNVLEGYIRDLMKTPVAISAESTQPVAEEPSPEAVDVVSPPVLPEDPSAEQAAPLAEQAFPAETPAYPELDIAEPAAPPPAEQAFPPEAPAYPELDIAEPAAAPPADQPPLPEAPANPELDSEASAVVLPSEQESLPEVPAYPEYDDVAPAADPSNMDYSEKDEEMALQSPVAHLVTSAQSRHLVREQNNLPQTPLEVMSTGDREGDIDNFEGRFALQMLENEAANVDTYDPFVGI